MGDLATHIDMIGEKELLDLATLFLGKVEMPFSRQRIRRDLLALFAREDVRENLTTGASARDASALSLVKVFGPIDRAVLARMLGGGDALWTVDNLKKRTLLVMTQKGLLDLNDSLDYSLILNRETFSCRVIRSTRNISLRDNMLAICSIANLTRFKALPILAKNLVEKFQSAFPLLSSHDLYQLGLSTLESGLRYGFIREDNGTGVGGMENFERFFSQSDEVLRMLLVSSQIDDAPLYDSLMSAFETKRALSFFCALTGRQDLSSPQLSDLSFLYDWPEDDGQTGTMTVTSDLSIYLSSMRGHEILALFTRPVSVDRSVHLTLDRESVNAGLALGLDPQRMISALSQECTLPYAVRQRIEDWAERYRDFSLTLCICLETDEHHAAVIDRIPEMREYIIKKVSPTIYLMKRSGEGKWRDIIEKMGLGLLPPTMVEEDAEKKGEAPFPRLERYSLEGLAPLFTPPEQSYRKNLDSQLTRIEDDRVRQALTDLVDNGQIVTEDQLSRRKDTIASPFTVSGFNHSGKMMLLEKARRENHKVRIDSAIAKGVFLVSSLDTADRQNATVTVIDQDGVRMKLPIAKIFRLTELPL